MSTSGVYTEETTKGTTTFGQTVVAERVSTKGQGSIEYEDQQD